MSDEIIKVITSVKGQHELDELTKTMKASAAAVVAHDAALQAAAVGSKSYFALTKALTSEAEKLAEAQKKHIALTKELRKAGTETFATGGKMWQFAQMVDDMQYMGTQGIRPLLNNIM